MLVGQLIVTLALFATYAAVISVLLPARVAELDPRGKVSALAAILSIAFVVTALAQPIIGALSDRTRTRFGRRIPWMAAGAIVGGVTLGLLGAAPSIVLLGVLWTIAQPSLSAAQVSTDAYLVDVFPSDRRGLAAGVVGIAVVAGAAVGAALSGSFAARPSTAFWILAGSIVAAVIVFAAIVRGTPPPPRPRPWRRGSAAIRAVAATVVAHPDYVKVLLWRFGYSIAYGAVFAYLLYILTDLVGVPKVEAARLIGLATVLGGAAALASVIVGGWLSDRIGRRRLFMLIGNAVLVAGDLLLLAWPTVPAALVTAVLFGIGLGLSTSCGRALASLVLPDQARAAGAGLGVLNTAANLGQAAAPAIGGLAIGWGGYPAVFVTSIVGAVACSVAVALVKTVR